MPTYIAAIICLAAVLHASYGALIAPVAALVLLPVLIIRRQDVRASIVPLVIGALALTYLITCFTNGFNAESFCAALLPLAAAILAGAISTLNRVERRSLLATLAAFGALIATIGFLLYAFLPSSDVVVGKHLTYGFYTANHAALWFGVLTLITFPLITHNRFLCLPLAINSAALLLTCAPLMVAAWLIALLVIFVKACRSNDTQTKQLFFYIFAGIVFAVAYYFGQNYWILETILLVAFVALIWFMEAPVEKFAPTKAPLALAAIVVLAVIVGTVFSLRIQEELPVTLYYTVVFALDALRALAANPFDGIGAGMWTYQGIWYRGSSASCVHTPNSFLDMGTEAGIIAVALLIVLFIIALAQVRKCHLGYTTAFALVFFATLFNCTFTQLAFWGVFTALAATATAEKQAAQAEAIREAERTVFDKEDAEPVDLMLASQGPRIALPLNITAVVLTAILSIFGFNIMGQVNSYVAMAAEGTYDYTTLTSTFVSAPVWVMNSPVARIQYDNAAYLEGIAGDYESEIVIEEADCFYLYLNISLIYDEVV